MLALSFLLPESTPRSYLISFVFPILVEAAGAMVTFGLFVIINVVSVGFVAKFVPETRGRTLEELEDDFRTHDAAHLVHPAPVDWWRTIG